jgi:hypothetical protein
MARAEGRNEGPEDDPDNAKHGHWRLLETDRKGDDYREDGVVATDSCRSRCAARIRAQCTEQEMQGS